MATFHEIKLSYTVHSVKFTRLIPDDLFSECVKTRMKDCHYSEYDAIIYVIFKLAHIFSNGEHEKIECEYEDEYGFKVKMER